ncbi:hypothetical protein GLOIN_2v1886575 [Rhizophagus irregularis DAOM 181602=DAOM 197198]|uniref:Uncharacterized protein n=1 Tax=Rhizophagus irregularis (strain DAOM 181602 / DAOM 197198 / MUCL 43194) TaxID=747089 RepID=A0A2P4NPZ0_RHIID|nr:hypothetical protein GLOIN_2v1886575 [Rhizophagus irregularis DAOM 181602=DAOM 197198]POG55201.1 hypothetical protein GLOIN_2v1886575 [Rhizophagus irregularis DAOM 181602=DAOM 197198]|eukprot:XP_025164289.1 hypothetical protein GLOIN_2v1886575 [Rhizophagus irregularis DAOM 181602=DAOM 197198]
MKILKLYHKCGKKKQIRFILLYQKTFSIRALQRSFICNKENSKTLSQMWKKEADTIYSTLSKMMTLAYKEMSHSLFNYDFYKVLDRKVLDRKNSKTLSQMWKKEADTIYSTLSKMMTLAYKEMSHSLFNYDFYKVLDRKVLDRSKFILFK